MLDEEGNIIMCRSTGKRCYTSREADTVLAVVKTNFKGRRTNRKTGNGKIPKRKFWCSACQSYHLTSQSYSGNSERKDGKRHKKYIKIIYNKTDY